MTSNSKICPEHLARCAIVYVRQSTLDQVRHHPESRRRQYDLAAHARTLGWREVLVIDEDLGKSGATAADRAGFQRLVAEVSLGRVGAVVGTRDGRLEKHPRTARLPGRQPPLQATQSVPYAPWAIASDRLRAEDVQRAVAAVKAGQKFPQTASETQLTLTNARI